MNGKLSDDLCGRIERDFAITLREMDGASHEDVARMLRLVVEQWIAPKANEVECVGRWNDQLEASNKNLRHIKFCLERQVLELSVAVLELRSVNQTQGRDMARPTEDWYKTDGSKQAQDALLLLEGFEAVEVDSAKGWFRWIGKSEG
jgi:hypothetical protein